MDFILILVIIVLLIIIISKLNSTRTVTTNLENNVYRLNEKLKGIADVLASLQKQQEILHQQQPPVEAKAPEIQQPPAVINPVQAEDAKEEPIIEPLEEPVLETAILEPVLKKPFEVTTPVHAPQIKESWFQQWLRNNPDIEKFIGENLINKIGIAVLILGIAFFVKYAIDQNWINEVGRVCIGLFCGVILIAVAHRLRKNYRSFSSVLVGGGLTVFYFTIAFAFHQYQLISQPSAFAIMVIITVFAVVLSILYDRMELAILATIGGFITPFLVSKGEGNYIILFTYLCILNAGLIVLSFYKRWHVLHFIAFVLTAIIYGGWIASNHSTKTFSYPGTFLFGTVFYFMFLTMNILLYLKKEVKLIFSDAALLIIVNLGYYSAGIYLLHQWQPLYKGLFTAMLGVINLLLATFLYKRKHIDRNFIFLLIGVTLTFISLAAPVQLEGNYITIFWAAELVLLFWLYQQSFIKLFKIASALITILTFISLLLDWEQAYILHQNLLPVIINKAFTTTVFCAASMIIMVALMRKEANSFYLKSITNNAVRLFYLIAAIILFFNAGLFEIAYQFNTRYSGTGLQYPYLLLYISAYVLLLIWVSPILKFRINYSIVLAIATIPVLYYLFTIKSNYFTEQYLLQTNNLKWHFLAHWFGAVLLLLLILQIIKQTRLQTQLSKKFIPVFTWVTAIIVIIFFSIEIKNVYVWLTYHNPGSFVSAENLYSKAGLSIVWGLLSFTFIWLGMHFGFKTLRIIALLLFGITLLKLFAIDLKNIPPGGKIIAFILLGVLLLTVSFMYQRLKKLIIDDTNNKA